MSLRDFLEKIDKEGELKIVNGVDWNREMGAIVDIYYKKYGRNGKALLFDEIKGYPKGCRTLFGFLNSQKRLGIAMGINPQNNLMDFVNSVRGLLKNLTPIEPVFEENYSFENVQKTNIDLLAFPVPLLHERDGGRYIGTGNCVITKNPENERINVGTYRMQVFSKDKAGIYISPGKHGRMDRDAYFAKGEKCPVVVTLGQDPALWIFSTTAVESPSKYGEIAMAGGVKREPIPLVEGELTGLPIPVEAEIVLEGYILPDEFHEEGPFGEWTGYYGSSHRSENVFKVKRIYYKDNPILCCASPGIPPYDYSFFKSVVRSANLWDQMEKAGVPNIKGVWRAEEGGSRLYSIVSIKNSYPGHDRQAGHVAAMCRAGAYAGRWVIVVDDDIDPSNINQVIWALSTRCDPARHIEFIDRAWSTPLDPMVFDKSNTVNSRAIIYAVKPIEKKDEFPEEVKVPEDYRKFIEEKWKHVL